MSQMNDKSKPSFLFTTKMRERLSEQKYLKIVCVLKIVKQSDGSRN